VQHKITDHEIKAPVGDSRPSVRGYGMKVLRYSTAREQMTQAAIEDKELCLNAVSTQLPPLPRRKLAISKPLPQGCAGAACQSLRARGSS